MDKDFWKQFPVIPGFDCMKMKRAIHAKIYRETKSMTQEERIEYYRQGRLRLGREGLARPRGRKTAHAQEEGEPYGNTPADEK